MKTKMLLALICALTFSMAGYSQITKAEIMATGLTCSMCSNAINKQLKALPEVESISTDLNTNTFTVQLKKGNQLTPLALRQRVEKAGFFVGSMIITLALDHPILDAQQQAILQDNTYVFVGEDSRQLQGLIEVKVMDKGFLTPKEYKKAVSALSHYPTYTAGAEKTFHVKRL